LKTFSDGKGKGRESALLWPNLVGSEDAPTTAKCEEVKKVFAAVSVAILTDCMRTLTVFVKSEGMHAEDFRRCTAWWMALRLGSYARTHEPRYCSIFYPRHRISEFLLTGTHWTSQF
jgi:hypothetical protein